MCSWRKCALSCISWEAAYLLCWSQGWLYFISRQTGNWRTYFQGEKWQGTQMKNLLSWGRGDKVHCDYIDFKLLCRAGTSLCLVLLMMRGRKEEGVNIPLTSVSKYFVTRMITESSLSVLMIPPCKGKGILSSSVEPKGAKRHRETEICFFFFWQLTPVHCLPESGKRAVPCAVRSRCLQSVCAPSSTRDDINGKQSVSELDAFFVKSTMISYTTNYN